MPVPHNGDRVPDPHAARVAGVNHDDANGDRVSKGTRRRPTALLLVACGIAGVLVVREWMCPRVIWAHRDRQDPTLFRLWRSLPLVHGDWAYNLIGPVAEPCTIYRVRTDTTGRPIGFPCPTGRTRPDDHGSEEHELILR